MKGKKIFNEFVKDPELKEIIGRGRSRKLVERRNELLLSRYYYYGSYKGLLYDQTLKLLERELFIRAHTIANIISDNIPYLQALRERRLVLYSFRQRWPHIKW